MTPREVLLEAARLLDDGVYDWTQGAFLLDDTDAPFGWDEGDEIPRGVCSACAIGIIYIAGDDDPQVAREAVKMVPVPGAPRRGGSALVDWNDAEGRTKDEVVALLREAAK